MFKVYGETATTDLVGFVGTYTTLRVLHFSAIHIKMEMFMYVSMQVSMCVCVCVCVVSLLNVFSVVSE